MPVTVAGPHRHAPVSVSRVRFQLFVCRGSESRPRVAWRQARRSALTVSPSHALPAPRRSRAGRANEHSRSLNGSTTRRGEHSARTARCRASAVRRSIRESRGCARSTRPSSIRWGHPRDGGRARNNACPPARQIRKTSQNLLDRERRAPKRRQRAGARSTSARGRRQRSSG